MLKKSLAAGLAVILAGITAASGQNFPTKPLTMIVPFAAGGPTDVLGRVIAQRMGEILGQSVTVENVGGAGGMTGSKRVADAPPDGYTFVLGTVGTHAQGQTLYKKPLYNAATDFTPVALIAEVPIILIARKDLPPNNFKDFVTYAKANQAKMQYGSAGTGSATHLACVLMGYVIGANITHVPYRGTGPAMQDLIAGRIDYLCDVIQTSLPLIQSHSIKALALLSPQRATVLPEVKTADEQGLTGFDADAWNAFFLPKGTPAPIVARLAKATSEVLDTPAMRERLEALGLNVPLPARRTPDYLAKLLVSELDKWAEPVKASGVSIE
jgi:tripartite-type tricarboxylate transporter receptor subunit TctC